MHIIWHGLSCFEVVAKTPAGEMTLVVDPYDNTTGLRFPRTIEAQVVATSHDAEDANAIGALLGSPFIVDMPGEFETKGLFVYSMSAPIKSGAHRLFRFEAEDMSIAHLGTLDRELTEEELKFVQGANILMVPCGGGRVLDGKQAAAVVSHVEPGVVIPMTFGVPNLKETLASVDDFYKAVGTCQKEETGKLKLQKRDLPEEGLKCVTMTR
ncbi:MBL fold metallo-hydrolase [Candidatus Uhrbacteria bacterium]|nr:MBL fold metallo-hydrolase [Candidatus Uhrbacteria bacterium]